MIYHISQLALVCSSTWVAPTEMKQAMMGAQSNGTEYYIGKEPKLPIWQPMCPKDVKSTVNETDWIQEKTANGDDACDAYSLGTGRCIFQVDLNQSDEEVNELFLAKGNCAVPKKRKHGGLETWGTQIMFCPTTRPISLYAVPKSGSTSAGNWLSIMDLPSKEKLLALGSEVAKGDPDKAAEYQTWAVSQDFPEVKDLEVFKKYNSRLLFRWPGKENLKKRKHLSFLPPGGYCPMCCARGHGRQKVLLARNPYVRLVSYFRMVVLEQPKYSSYYYMNGIHDFESWAIKVFSHRKSDGSWDHPATTRQNARKVCLPHCIQKAKKEFENTSTAAPVSDEEKGKEIEKKKCPPRCISPNYEVLPMDSWHVKPVSDMFRENIAEPYLGQPKNLLDGFHILHLETLADDIKDLAKLLCENYNDCDPLPTYPTLKPPISKEAIMGEGGVDECKFDFKSVELKDCAITWKELWTPQLLELVAEHFSEDFDLLGYKNDPFDLMPTHKAPKADRSEL